MAGILFLLMSTVLAQKITSDPDVNFLLGEGGADWLRMPEETGPTTYGAEDFFAAYRTTFHIEELPDSAPLYVRPYRYAEVWLDGQLILNTDPGLDKWKQRYGVDLGKLPLEPGPHELMLSVLNRTGPPMVLAYCSELGIETGDSWEATDYDTKGWVTARTWREPQVNTIAEQLPTVPQAMRDWAPLYIFLFLLGAGWTVLATSRWSERLPKVLRDPSPATVRWAALVAWAILIFNNITLLPYNVGFDIEGHLQYMTVVARKGRIPFAHEGWQMFQAPLYYLVSAPLYSLVTTVWSETLVPEMLRIIPMTCGAVMIEIVYRTLRVVFPDDPKIQRWGIVLGGFLPINVYLSQNIANEPLAAVLAASALLVAFVLVRRRDEKLHVGMWLLLGMALGASILTKVTAILLIPVFGLVLLYVTLGGARDVPNWVGRVCFAGLAAFGTMFAICGWWFVYNYAETGRPFMGGWDPARGYIWWQEPGYRSIQQYTTFGYALVQPVYSAVHGYWDGLYSTLWLDGFAGSHVNLHHYSFWNFDFLLHCAWLSLAPTALIATGGARTIVQPNRSARESTLLATICLSVYLAAIAYLSLTIASFSTFKASYMLSLAPCFAVLFALGYKTIARPLPVRAVIHGLMTCWIVAVYMGYFVLPE